MRYVADARCFYRLVLRSATVFSFKIGKMINSFVYMRDTGILPQILEKII